VASVEGRTSDAEDQRVGGDKSYFLPRGEAAADAGSGDGVDEGARFPRRPGVACGGDDGDVVAGIGLERGVQLGELGVADAVLSADLPGWAERDDAALDATELQGGH
jgi:hypothetical protein